MLQYSCAGTTRGTVRDTTKGLISDALLKGPGDLVYKSVISA